MDEAAKPEKVLELVGQRLGHFRDRSEEGSLCEHGKQGCYQVARCYDQGWYPNNEPELPVHIPQPQPEAGKEEEEGDMEKEWDGGDNEVHSPTFHGLEPSLPLLRHSLVVFCLDTLCKESAPLQTEHSPSSSGQA